MRWIRRLRLLALLILFSAVGLVVRIGNVADGLGNLAGDARAQEDTTPAQNEPAEAGEAAEAVPSPSDEATQTGNGPAVPVDPLMMTRSELDLLQNLAERRAELQERENQFELRERLLAATEQRIDGKIVRLEALEAQISAFVRLHEEQENAQLQSIVKVYETMKPKAAAVIFQRLDMEIQLELATRMKEAKMAPILAAMETDAARQLTTRLALRLELPDLGG